MPQVIRADEAYTVPEFRRRAALGDYAFREVRRAGLRVVEVGKKRYVRGIDWLEFLDRAAVGSENDEDKLDETNNAADTDGV